MNQFHNLSAAFFFTVILGSCKKEIERPIIENVSSVITLTGIEAQPGQITLRFVYDGALPQAKVGIVYSDDSLSLLSKIESKFQETLNAPSDKEYTYTFERSSAENMVYYSFCLSVDGRQYYSPVHKSSFGLFKFTEFGFTADNVLSSISAPEYDYDFQYLIANSFGDFENLKLYVDNKEALYKITTTNTPRVIAVKLPEPVKTGTYELRMVYKGIDVLYRRFYIPEGRLFLRSQHPNYAALIGNYVYDSKIHTITLGSEPTYVEYSTWNPVSNLWHVERSSNLPDNYSFTNLNNNGIPFNGKIFFYPKDKFLDIDNMPYYQQTILELDPELKNWKEHVIWQTPMREYNDLFHLTTVNDVAVHGNKFYILQYGFDTETQEQGYQVYSYAPADTENLRKKVASLSIPEETLSAQLIVDGDNFYIVSFLTYNNPWNSRDYEMRIYRTNASFESLSLILTIPVGVTASLAEIMNRKIYVFGGYRAESSGYSITHFGLEYDIDSNKWRYLNPSYSTFGVPTSNFLDRFLFKINGRFFFGYSDFGEIMEWDVHYAK